ncbi:YbjN domain-containing protein [Isoptericola sp. S6320L]|uniref:YbjN domain-containing protein n=1 Tax=Isoptericola sp. S6320L TaxID=2926411 RepID=UPI001FF6387A|nr:YbjN domain-containing protein [Isoptericola sp. S6320L]MCK0116645.1 YbjN domain-containing protein [Isoptericola sp. S6320L]
MRFFGARRATRSSAPSVSEGGEPDRLRADVQNVLLAGPVGDAVGAVPAPVSNERISAWLDQSGFTYFVDTDGDLGGLWHGRLFYFLPLGPDGEVLQVRGQWHREATIERLSDVLEVCNEWNAERIWPKTYARVRDDGAIVVCAEVTVSVEHGANDDQLAQHLQCGLSTSAMFFEHLDAVFADPLGSAP